MSLRLPGLVALLAALLATLPAVAGAAVPRNVERVIADYRSDGRIDPCEHTAADYRDTLEEVSGATEQYAPDFPDAVEAARDAREREDCTQEPAGGGSGDGSADDGEDAGGAATPTPTPTPAPAPPAPDPEPSPAPAAPLPSIDDLGDDPPPAATPAPSQEVVPEPPAPAGSGAGITPGSPPAGEARPNVALTRPAAESGSGVAPAPVVVLGGLLAAAALAGLVYLVMRRFGWGEQRLAGLRHAVGEAGYRTGGTWQSFTDWVRVGR